MKYCAKCGHDNRDFAKFCDECGFSFGSEITAPEVSPEASSAAMAEVSVLEAAVSWADNADSQVADSAPVTKIDMVPVPESNGDSGELLPKSAYNPAGSVHSVLILERIGAPAAEFPLTADDSYIGRWDADNGIFPDVDLDAFDPDAKVSRRHARILRREAGFAIEDLGSTNGTFVNRGRRLLPGSPHPLRDGDEIIVGKTFLRFKVRS